MNALTYSDIDVDPADIAADRMARRPSISGTAGCRGCDDPQCGYCDILEERKRQDRIDAEREKIIADGSDLRELFVDLEWDNPDAVAGILRAAVRGDYIIAGERIRNLLMPKIDDLADRRAA